MYQRKVAQNNKQITILLTADVHACTVVQLITQIQSV